MQMQMPKRKEHPDLVSSFIELTPDMAANNSMFTRGDTSNSRMMRELRALASVHPTFDVYFCESNIFLLKVVLAGPSGTPYANGNFLLCMSAFL
jgi:hypothetical protein